MTAPTSHWCLHIEAACKAEKTPSISLKPVSVESVSIRVDGEAAISGNVFVWEANSTGIDRWSDGMEWTVQEEVGFEVGEAAEGSGLMRKIISILVSGCLHHVVSYYTASYAPTLAPPSREHKLRSELASVLTATGPS